MADCSAIFIEGMWFYGASLYDLLLFNPLLVLPHVCLFLPKGFCPYQIAENPAVLPSSSVT